MLDNGYYKWYLNRMGNRHIRTLQRIFSRPTPANVQWAEIESLMRAVGVDVIEAEGSRVHLVAKSLALVVHRPHPRPEVGGATVQVIREFLREIGVTP